VSAGHGEQPLIQVGVQDERLRTEAAELRGREITDPAVEARGITEQIANSLAMPSRALLDPRNRDVKCSAVRGAELRTAQGVGARRIHLRAGPGDVVRV
jgi:hypothetical protein